MPVPGEILEALEAELSHTLPFWKRLTAAQLFVGSFLVLILFGTVLLLVLPGLYTGERLGVVDALFTATSAVCVTGLIVVDTATYFTPLGQAVLLFLIQLGGLGILTLTTLLIFIMGRRLSLRAEQLSGASDALPHLQPGSLLRGVFLYTFVIEGVGAIALFLAWMPRLGAQEALWPAIFHAVSAFCNAGFSLFSDSLVRFAGHPPTIAIVSLLVIIGSLGFLVLVELKLTISSQRRRLSVHTRLVLVTTAILLLGGTLLFTVFEWNNSLARFPWYVRPLEAFLYSTMPRSGGFNTAEYALLTPASLFLTIGLMMIGGSPGSTAGGFKTTTFALLGIAAWSRIRGREHSSVFRRTLPEATLHRATGLIVYVMAILGGAILLLQITEFGARPYTETAGGFMQMTFEAVSAFNIVGLSTGITGGLSDAGKLILTVLMFAGRVGPLTLVASMIVAARRRTVHMRYSTEDVIIG